MRRFKYYRLGSLLLALGLVLNLVLSVAARPVKSRVVVRNHLSLQPVSVPATLMSDANVVRFLEQSTFGPNDALIAQVQTAGFDPWLQAQFTAPVSWYPSLSQYPQNNLEGCVPGVSPTTCFRDNYTMYPLQVQFFKNALTGQDQLRQRVAFALSQMFVVSGVKLLQPSLVGNYLNILTERAFSNYRQILSQVTLSPAMGNYLDMVNNDKPDNGVQPNENYAREILQLFSIGTVMLNQDGTPKRSVYGITIPSYDQNIIEGFAHVFTGWTYATLAGQAAKIHNPPNYLQPLWLYRDASGVDSNHDKAEKVLLNYPNAQRAILPAGQDGVTDLNQALDNIFFHPNVGPFIGKQLIQHLVTSNPSPAYVSRVAAAFNNNGAGIRGDMKAVIKAILLDLEARGDASPDPQFGKLREPVLLVTNLLRAFDTTTDYVLTDYAKGMGQNLFYSPTVFNYFPPDYVLPGSSLTGPEFAIQSSSLALVRLNFVNTLITGKVGATTANFQIDWTGLQAVAGDANLLVEKLNRLLLHGAMSASMRNDIVTAVAAVAATDTKLRAQTALYLVATSSQYQVER